MSKGRLEAFSDGVIAVAITLLVLGLVVPPPGSGSLATSLGDDWPKYVAYVVSFITIGIIWINHHAMIGRLRETDHAILMLNLLLLLTIGLLPFATNLMATYLRRPGEHLATGIYTGCFLLMSVAFAALNRHILVTKSHLLSHSLSEHERRTILIHSVAGLLPYALATVLAVLSAYLSLAIDAGLAVFYALPIA
jgi:uncharacterized membrane protein